MTDNRIWYATKYIWGTLFYFWIFFYIKILNIYVTNQNTTADLRVAFSFANKFVFFCPPVKISKNARIKTHVNEIVTISDGRIWTHPKKLINPPTMSAIVAICFFFSWFTFFSFLFLFFYLKEKNPFCQVFHFSKDREKRVIPLRSRYFTKPHYWHLSKKVYTILIHTFDSTI